MIPQQARGALVKAWGSRESFPGRLMGNCPQEARAIAHRAEGSVHHGLGGVRQAVERTPEPDATQP